MNQNQPAGNGASRSSTNSRLMDSKIAQRGRTHGTSAASTSGGATRLPILKDWFLIIRPDQTWNAIAAEQRGAGFILFCYLLPMMLLAALAEGLGLMSIGRHRALAGLTNQFPLNRVCAFEITQLLLTVLLLLAAAIFIKSFGNACHRRNHLAQSLVVLFHGVGPLFLVQLFNAIPSLTVLWVTWVIGFVLVIATLYYGLPRIMRPDPPSAMGLFLGSGFVLFLLLFAGRLFTYLYLSGDLHIQGTVLSGIAAKLAQ